MEGGGGTGCLGKVLSCGSSGSAVVWGKNVGDISKNIAEVRGSECGFPDTGNKVKDKVTEGRVVEEGGDKKLLQGMGTQPLQTYLDRRQVTVVEWVDLRPIIGVFTRDTGYEGGGELQVTWRRQAAVETQLKVTV